ncbi:hypothetical protein QO010_000901 [Caulobacter ginsengisoli]|uniref:DUF1453 domain-containing protein n=1 Tax=Caulobacter ginsengisoli TaxID=400775 RepID=A0ABU0IPQ7_9CAUL|nr:CcdC protein domain-containing protein [Caulobacter ginsengisoli]MDQ0463153.1 hypothetical protein [Caulobacter ginsengisoli]
MPYLIGLPIMALVLFFRFRRVGQDRPLKVEWMWIVPTIMIVMAGLLTWVTKPAGQQWLWLASAAVVGGAIGWYRGKLMAITVDPETHALTSRTSQLAMLFLLALIAVRFGLRAVIDEYAAQWHVSINLVSDAFVVFAVGLLGVTRLEMFLRAMKLLAEARSQRPSSAA